MSKTTFSLGLLTYQFIKIITSLKMIAKLIEWENGLGELDFKIKDIQK